MAAAMTLRCRAVPLVIGAAWLCRSPAGATCAPGITPLDPHSALVVVDLQRSIQGAPTPLPIDRLVANARTMMDAFRAHAMPVILVRSSAQPPGRIQQVHVAKAPADPRRSELLDGLGQQASDHVIEKMGWSAFTRTDLAAFLAGNHVTQVVIAGYSTTIAVEATARDAYDRGYNVTIVSDAITDPDAAGQDWVVSKLFPRLGTVLTTRELGICLAGGP